MTTENQVGELHSTWRDIHERIERGLQALPMSRRMTVLGFIESMVDDSTHSRSLLDAGIAKGIGDDFLTGYAAALLQEYGWAERAGALLPKLIERHGQWRHCLWAFAITVGSIAERTTADDFSRAFWDQFEKVAQELKRIHGPD